MNSHCQAAKDAIAIAESGDSKMAAYRRAAEEIEKAIDEDGLTQREIAAQVDKHQSYVARLLKALMSARITNSDFRVDWSSGSNKRSEIATSVPRQLADQVKMAAELLARPEVAEEIVRSSTLASTNVQQAVTRQNVEERDLSGRMAERRLRERAVPVSGYHARVVGRLQEWAGELVAIGPDLIESCEDAFLAHSIGVALRDLATQCTRLADRIDLDINPDTIEGRVLS